MNILFVDDIPDLKVNPTIEYLKKESLDFSYKIVKSVATASLYITNHLNEIDLAIIDLGLPMLDGAHRYNSLDGLVILDKILSQNVNIPTIINSTTEIPDEKEYLKLYTDEGAIIKHIKLLDGKQLIDFINQL